MPKLACKREGLNSLELAQRREGLYLVPQLAQGVHLLPPGCTEDLFFFLACTRSTARRSLTGLNSLDGEKDFIWCLNLPRVYISSPLDALRTFLFLACTRSTARRSFTCLYIAPGVTSSRSQKHGGLSLFLPCTRSTARRSFTCLRTRKGVEVFHLVPPIADRR